MGYRESKCGKTGNCFVYDHNKFRHYLHGGAIAFMAIGSLFDFCTIFFADRVQNFYEDEEKKEEEEENSTPSVSFNQKAGLTVLNPTYGRRSMENLTPDFERGN